MRQKPGILTNLGFRWTKSLTMLYRMGWGTGLAMLLGKLTLGMHPPMWQRWIALALGILCGYLYYRWRDRDEWMNG